MKRINNHSTSVTFYGGDGDKVRVAYDNRGEPYREGVSVDLDQGGMPLASVFLDTREALHLRDMLLELYPVEEAK